MLEDTIEDLVNRYVNFKGRNSKGWNVTYCEVCGDGSRVKGPRGGWLFSDEITFYSCFNCGVEGNFSPDRQYPFSKDMRKIFDSFGIPSNEYNAIAYKNVIEGNKKGEKKVEKKKPTYTKIEQPDFFYSLEDALPDNIYYKKAIEELKYRNIDPSSYPFFLSNGKSKSGPRMEAIAKSMMNRLIIPFYDSRGNLIYYQGRSFDKNAKQKYLNADVLNTGVIYGMDRLYEDTEKPLFVTEGFFDAYHLKGASLQHNYMTSQQLELLNKSPRKKVFVPDKKSDSSKAVDQFAEMGWYVSVPDIGNSCKDIDDAIRKYGKLYTLSTVASNIETARTGKLLLRLNGFIYK